MINIQNIDDNEWCVVRYLNPPDHHPVRITKADNNFSKRLNFKGIKVPAKTRDIHKKEKKIPSALVFWLSKERKKIQFMYQKNLVKKNMLIYY